MVLITVLRTLGVLLIFVALAAALMGLLVLMGL